MKTHLNLRSGSGTNYQVIGKLEPGQEITIVGEDGAWYEVTVPDKTGYVYKDYVELLEKKKEDPDAVDSEFLSMLICLIMKSMEQEVSLPSLTPDGNLTLVDDIGSSMEEGQQFITLTTKDGNFFYLIIDRNDKGEENVHFLNLVDEQDLFSLMEEEEVEAYKAEKEEEATETEKDSSGSWFGFDSTENKAEKAETDPSKEQEAEEKTGKSGKLLAVAALVILVAVLAGGIVILRKKKSAKKAAEIDPDEAYAADEAYEQEEYVIPEEKAEGDVDGAEVGYVTTNTEETVEDKESEKNSDMELEDQGEVVESEVVE